jgi:hypothetical protein
MNQCRKVWEQCLYLGLALREFLVFEGYCFRSRCNWVATQAKSFQEAVWAFRVGRNLGLGVTRQLLKFFIS